MNIAVAFGLATCFVASNADTIEQAKTYFSAGQQAYEARQYLAAAAAFEQAFELSPQPAILFSTAQAYRLHFLIARQTQHLVSAIRLYREYLVRAPAGSRRLDAAEHLATLEIRLAQLGDSTSAPESPKPQLTQIMVASRTPDAMVSISGERPKPVPVVKDVDAGAHRVRVERDGFFPEEIEVTAVEGRLVVRDILLKERPGRLTVSTQAGAEILIDGRPVGEAPLGRSLRLPSGRHSIAVRALGKKSYNREIILDRGKETYLHVLLDDTGQRTLSYWVLGAGGVAFAASIATGVTALAFRGRAEFYLAQRTEPDEILTPADLQLYRGDRARQRELGQAFWSTLTVSAVLSAFGMALYLLDTPSISDDAPLLLAPIATQDGYGIAAKFDF